MSLAVRARVAVVKASEKELFQQHGLLRGSQLVAAGLSRKRLRRLLRDGHVRPLAGDVFALPGLPAVDEDLRAAAVALGATVCARSAALQYGWAMIAAPERPLLAVGRNRSRATHEAVNLWRVDLPPDDITELDGLPITTKLRTALDCCLELDMASAVVLIDSALRAKDVTLAELETALLTMPDSRNKRRIATVLARCDPHSGSVIESLCRHLLLEAGLAPEETQYVVRRGRSFVGRVDLAWPSARLLVECDGFEFHSDRDAYRKDRRRLNALVLAGWRVLRFSFEDVVSSPAYVVESVRTLLTGDAAVISLGAERATA